MSVALRDLAANFSIPEDGKIGPKWWFHSRQREMLFEAIAREAPEEIPEFNFEIWVGLNRRLEREILAKLCSGEWTAEGYSPGALKAKCPDPDWWQRRVSLDLWEEEVKWNGVQLSGLRISGATAPGGSAPLIEDNADRRRTLPEAKFLSWAASIPGGQPSKLQAEAWAKANGYSTDRARDLQSKHFGQNRGRGRPSKKGERKGQE